MTQLTPESERELPRESEPPVIAPGYSFASITDHISSIVLAGRTGRGWLVGFAVSFALVMVLNV